MKQKDNLIQIIIRRPLISLFVFIQFIIILTFILTIIRIQSNNKASNGTVVNNDGSYNQKNIPEVKMPILDEFNLPGNSKTNIQRAMAETLSKNIDTFKKEGLAMAIREKKEINFSNYGVKYINFIIDIPEYKQSYQIRHEWSNDENNTNLAPNDSTIVACIKDENKIKYKNFECIDGLSYDLKYSDVGHYLPLAIIDDDLDASISDKNFKRIIVNMTATDKTNEQAKKKVDAWIKSIGYTPDGFEYEFYDGDSL